MENNSDEMDKNLHVIYLYQHSYSNATVNRY